jgi:hypothetical protein
VSNLNPHSICRGNVHILWDFNLELYVWILSQWPSSKKRSNHKLKSPSNRNRPVPIGNGNHLWINSTDQSKDTKLSACFFLSVVDFIAMWFRLRDNTAEKRQLSEFTEQFQLSTCPSSSHRNIDMSSCSIVTSTKQSSHPYDSDPTRQCQFVSQISPYCHMSSMSSASVGINKNKNN